MYSAVALSSSTVANDMPTLIKNVGALVTAFTGWLSSILAFVTNQPLLLIFVLLAVLGAVLAKLKKWLPGL